jgi:outer membrane usher protein
VKRELNPALVWGSLLFTALAHAQDPEPQSLAFSTFHANKYLCELWSEHSKEGPGDFLYSKDSLLKCLEPALDPLRFQELKIKWAPRQNIDANEIEDAGLKMSVDPTLFRIDMSYPPQWQRVSPVSVWKPPSVNISGDARTARHSAYLNYSANTYFVHNRTDPHTSFDAVLNPAAAMGGFVLESYHRYQSADERFARLDTHLTRDMESSLLRLRAGDNMIPSASLYGSYRHLGLSVNRNFGLSPHYVNRPLGEQDLFLERPSRVEIFVNGLLIRVLSLEAGRHEIRDIPTNRGINNVTLRITDSGGEPRLVQFQASLEETLLKAGLSDFSYNLGVLGTEDVGGLTYANDFVGSALYRRGLNNFWTAGVYSQASQNNVLLGLDNTLASSLGIFRLETALSSSESLLGSALRATYVWICPCAWRGLDQRFSLGAEWYSPKYLRRILPETYAETSLHHGVFASFSSTISPTISGQISASLNEHHSTQRDLQANLELNKRFGRATLTGLRYGQRRILGQASSDHEVGFQLTYHFDDGLRSINTYATLPSRAPHQLRADALYNNPVDQSSAQASVLQSSSSQRASLQGSRGWQHADLAAAVEVSSDEALGRASRFRLSPAGSIAYADGAWGFGRRIRDSYVVIDNQRNERLFVNGGEEVHEARIRPNGTAVITNAQAYQNRQFSLSRDSQADSAAHEIYTQRFHVRPKYKTATLITIEANRFVSARGVLADSAGQIVSLAGGELYDEANNHRIKFFTDHEGNFYIEGLNRSRYRVQVFTRPFEGLELDFSDSKTSLVDLDKVALTDRVRGGRAR